MFMEASTDDAYKQVVAEVKNRRAKGEVKDLPKIHPAVKYKFCWDKISLQLGPTASNFCLWRIIGWWSWPRAGGRS
jgi:hypothetical protein